MAMSDFLLVLFGVGIVAGAVLIVHVIERLTKCNHKWGYWEHKEDSAAFILKRQCDKCGYLEIEQHLKIRERKE